MFNLKNKFYRHYFIVPTNNDKDNIFLYRASNPILVIPGLTRSVEFKKVIKNGSELHSLFQKAINNGELENFIDPQAKDAISPCYLLVQGSDYEKKAIEYYERSSN